MQNIIYKNVEMNEKIRNKELKNEKNEKDK